LDIGYWISKVEPPPLVISLLDALNHAATADKDDVREGTFTRYSVSLCPVLLPPTPSYHVSSA
jgi:hypothetical protein